MSRKPELGSRDHIQLTEQYSSHNYSPLDVVLSRGEGAWVWDVEGERYLDLLSAYSALNFGHRNPRLIAAAKAQLDRLTLTSRAFYNDTLGLLCRELAAISGMEMVLLMNSGAEAVESAIKIARRWGYVQRGIAAEQAEIICMSDNFHGRTTTIVSFSDSAGCRKDFGPFTPGFKLARYGDLEHLGTLITPNTAAILVEPIQGEAGVIIPPDGYLRGLRRICDQRGLLLIADEIQTGLCRTGALFACDHEQVKPDLYLLGKSLGGGIVPISAVIGRRAVMEVLTPGSHGSTFGGNSFACAIALEVLNLIRSDQPHERALILGDRFMRGLRAIQSDAIEAVRGRGLLIGVDIRNQAGKAKKFCHALKEKGILCKDTRDHTLRIAPPLIISESDIDWALERFAQVFGAR